jgi:hypothetical protein
MKRFQVTEVSGDFIKVVDRLAPPGERGELPVTTYHFDHFGEFQTGDWVSIGISLLERPE